MNTNKSSKRIHNVTVKHLPDMDPDPSYLEQEGFEDRLRQYEDGQFGFMGVRAEAEIVVGDVIQTISSGGLWGIEDDSDRVYLTEVGAEELSQLRTILHEMGFSKRAIATAFKNVA